ncbi:MAG: hypothetical protein ACOYOJ_13250 [Alsobacter sp.]
MQVGLVISDCEQSIRVASRQQPKKFMDGANWQIKPVHFDVIADRKKVASGSEERNLKCFVARTSG